MIDGCEPCLVAEMNKIYFLLLLFAIPLFGETIKIKFDRQWHPKIKGLNHCWAKLVTSKPMALGSKNEDGSINRHELVLNFTPFAEHYSNSLKITEPLSLVRGGSNQFFIFIAIH